VLEWVNPFKQFTLKKTAFSDRWISEFSNAIYRLSNANTGALIVIERMDRVDEFITQGIRFEADPTPEIMMSIFQKNSPLHDGAVLIKDGQIQMVSCYLPLSSIEDLPPEWGTRHRAALGLAERCDAWVFIVSEEKGTIQIARGTQMSLINTKDQLKVLVKDAVRLGINQKEGWMDQIRSLIFTRWKEKLCTLMIISVIWFMFAGQQDFERDLTVPVELKNLPANLEILEPVNPIVKLRVRGRRKDVSLMDSKNVTCWIDLSMAKYGKRNFQISRNQINLLNERINIINIDPPEISFNFKEKSSS
jgi:hypothetical protein